MGMLLQDLRYGLRMLAKNPGFTAVAVIALALGIGANTAIFTLIDSVLLRSLPVNNPKQLVLFYDGDHGHVYSGHRFYDEALSFPLWEYFRDHNESFENTCVFRESPDGLVMRLVGSPNYEPSERASGHLVSGSYFQVLGVQAAVGRVLTPQDDVPSASPVTVISHNFWRRRFNLDRAVVGKTVDLNGASYTIVGVAPPEFFGERMETPPDFWLPLTYQPQVMQRESWLKRQDVCWLNLMGRLKTDVNIERAQTTLNTQLHQFLTAQAGARLSPEEQRRIENARLTLKRGAHGISSARLRYSEPLHILMAIVALVLLIACANVATLLLARVSARRQELFVRLAIGATRARLLHQLLTESILLALFGAAAGIMLAWWTMPVLASLLRISSVIRIRPDLFVLSFTVGTSILTGVLFGLVPALRASNVEAKTGSIADSWAFRDRSLLKPARSLVVLQLTLAFPLLVAAALLAHSLLDLERQDLGFLRDNLLFVRTDARLAGYQPAELCPLYSRLHDRLNTLPGVTSASIADYSPISGNSASGNFSIEGYAPPPGKQMDLYYVAVGPRFFETLGVPILLGRPIEAQDTAARPLVAVINNSVAQQYFPKQNPIGRHLSLGAPFKPPGAEIIGVAADSKYFDPRERPAPMAFFSAWQSWGEVYPQPRTNKPYACELMTRTSGDPTGAIVELRRAIAEIDSKLPILGVTTLRDQIHRSLQQERTITTLCSFFGILAVTLACVGLYGTVAYSVARRTHEMGIRMALGAKRSQVLWIVLRDALGLVAIGLALGLPIALTASRWVKSYLFGLPPVDPVGTVAALGMLGAVCGFAAYLPARRATKVDPMVTLRYE